MSIWSHISKHISKSIGRSFSMAKKRSVSGGSINTSYVIDGDNQKFFVKRNIASKLDMFIAEAEGLNEIAKSKAIRVPQPICWGIDEDSAYIVMEYIALGASGEKSFELFGEQLASMHLVTQTQFGWYRENTIGFTPQINTYSGNWAEFWQERRLKPQLTYLVRNGYKGVLPNKLERLISNLSKLLKGYKPKSSLLHGDLWVGNFAVDASEYPVIFDPAVYYGDRETDIAMTELFGGFSSRFTKSYTEVYPLDDGYQVRKTLYNLYHVLNHVNLFGGSYVSQAEYMTDVLLTEMG